MFPKLPVKFPGRKLHTYEFTTCKTNSIHTSPRLFKIALKPIKTSPSRLSPISGQNASKAQNCTLPNGQSESWKCSVFGLSPTKIFYKKNQTSHKLFFSITKNFPQRMEVNNLNENGFKIYYWYFTRMRVNNKFFYFVTNWPHQGPQNASEIENMTQSMYILTRKWGLFTPQKPQTDWKWDVCMYEFPEIS